MEQTVERRGSPKLALVLLMVIYMFNFMDRQILGVLAEPIKYELDIKAEQR